MSIPYKILVGDTATPQLRVPKTGEETYLAPVTINDVSGNEVGFDVQVVVAKAAGNDTAFRVNKIGTGPGVSLIQEWHLDGVSVASIDGGGLMKLNGINNAGTLTIITTVDDVFIQGDSDVTLVAGSSNIQVRETPTQGITLVTPGATTLNGVDLATVNAVVNNQTGTSYTILITDAGKTITFNNASPIAVEVPDGLPVGFKCLLVQVGAGTVTATASGSDTVNTAGAAVAAIWEGLIMTKFVTGTWFAIKT